MRIALITNVVAPYRVPLFEQIAHLPGCELLVIYEAAQEPNRNWSADRALDFDHVFLKSWTLDLRRLAPDAFVHLPRQPLAELRRFAPDVVVAGGAGIWSSPTNVAAVMGRRPNEKRRRGGTSAMNRRPGWALAPYWGSWGVAEWWESPRRHRPTLPRRLAEPWVRAFIRRGDAWIAYGSKAAAEVIRLGADPERTVVAPNAVPRGVTPPRPADKHHPPRFLFVGQLVKRKGIDVLLDAIKRVNAELWIAGDGPLRDHVEQASESDRRIRYLGHLGYSDLDRVYGEADALILPSRYEVWGLVVNEAMGHGLPVLVTDQVGAAADLVHHNVNGLVVAADSVEALASGMERLAEWSESDYAGAAKLSNELLEDWTIERAATEVRRACDFAVERR